MPKLYDVSNREVITKGVVLLNLTFPNNGLIQRKVPFVITELEDRILLGSNTVKARKLAVGSDGQEFFITETKTNQM